MIRCAVGDTALTIEDLTVTLPNGRQLFRQANLEVEQGQLVLLVGASGSGKSTLLRLIAGLEESERESLIVSGRLEILGSSNRRLVPGRVGLVFQSLALFEELTAVENVEFAMDHRTGPRAAAGPEAVKLLERLRVPIGTRLADQSGGERQRIAVARTLALDPPILLFDEPTTGLDPERARDVSALIAETHRQFNKTVIIVTHDFKPFLPFKPRLVLVDSRRGVLREMDEGGLTNHFDGPSKDGLTLMAPDEPSFISLAGPTPTRRSDRAAIWIEQPGRAIGTLFAATTAPFQSWTHTRWKLKYLWHFLRMTALGTTALYVAIAGAMLGFVFITFSFSNLPYREVTLPLLTEEFLAATGYSMFRVVVPLMIAVLLAGKCGASAAADLGARRLTHQFEAMRSLGGRPSAYLYGTLVIALAIGTPLLTLLGFLSSCYAALVAFLMTSPDATVAVFRRNFFATILPVGAYLPAGSEWVLVKTATTGILIAALAYEIGSRPKSSPVDVSRDVGLTIFWTSLAALMLHALYSFVEFGGPDRVTA